MAANDQIVLEKEFWEYKDGQFPLTETVKRTFTIDIESSLMKIKEIDAEIKKIPLQIESLTKRKEDLIKFRNEWFLLLVEAKEKYNLIDLELPENL